MKSLRLSYQILEVAINYYYYCFLDFAEAEEGDLLIFLS